MRRLQAFERELAWTEIWAQALSLFAAHFGRLVTPFLIGGAITGIVNLAVEELVLVPLGRFRELRELPPSPQTAVELAGLLVELLILGITVFLVAWVVSTYFQGIGIRTTSEALFGRAPELRAAVARVLPQLPSLLAAGFLAGLITVLGLVLLVVPGVIFALMFSMAIPIIVLEERGALEALGRSRRLTSRRWGKLFVVFALYVVLFTLYSGVAAALFAPVAQYATVMTNLAHAVPQGLGAVLFAVTYYSLLARETAAYSQPASA